MTRSVVPVLVGEKPDTEPKKKVTNAELEELLDAHELWLTGTMDRDNLPNLSGLDLSNVIISKRNLHQANFSRCNFENAKLLHCNLSKADLSGSILRGVNFTGSDLSEIFAVNADMSNCNFHEYKEGNVVNIGAAKMVKARLSAANLSNSSLCKVDLSGSDLQRCVFDNTSFWQTSLEDCVAQGAYFKGANFTFANLKNADLRMADLSNCEFKYANLTCTDLRDTKGVFFLNDNPIKETKFSPWSKDPYSQMRRTYTGIMFFLILTLTLLAFTPYIFKAITWGYMSEIQKSGLDYMPITLMQSYDNSNISESKIFQIDLSNNIKFKKSRVISIIVGLEEEPPWVPLFITCVLVIYNILRGYVTIQFSRLRDSEERSLHAPKIDEYKHLFYVHNYFLKWFMWGVIAFSIYNATLLLSKTIYIPV